MFSSFIPTISSPHSSLCWPDGIQRSVQSTVNILDMWPFPYPGLGGPYAELYLMNTLIPQLRLALDLWSLQEPVSKTDFAFLIYWEVMIYFSGPLNLRCSLWFFYVPYELHHLCLTPDPCLHLLQRRSFPWA